MVNSLSIVLQKLFFKGMKVRPNPAWRRRASSLGRTSQLSIVRQGKNISCVFIEPSLAASPDICQSDSVVILSHPITRKGKYFFTDTGRAKAYLDRGVSILAFDYNGFGESDHIDLFYWQDVVSVIEHAKAAFPNKKIILHGTSFGAFHIIRALNTLPSAADVILENVNKSLISYWQKWLLAGSLVKLLQFLNLRAIKDMEVQTVLRQFERTDLHVQFIACETDQITTLEEMRELYEILSSNNKTFTIFKGAGHLAAPNNNPELYQLTLFSRGYSAC